MLNPWSLITTTAGLIAFHIGLLTLVGRERKSPYVINSVFPIFLLSLLVAVTSVAAVLVPLKLEGPLLQFSGIALVTAIALSMYQVYRIAVRFIYFVDSISPKHWPIVRPIRRYLSIRSARPSYTHSTLRVPQSVQTDIAALLTRLSDGAWTAHDELELRSLAVAIEYQDQANHLLIQLALTFLVNGFSVQYMTASRHPIEFIVLLKNAVEQAGTSWPTVAKQIVVVDAYSPHFGFIDSVYEVKRRELDSLDVTTLRSKMTYAGIHSASSRAFQAIKSQMARGYRQPTLVVYEGTYSLVDLESAEQYRIFVRHVLPSERLWEGMFTVFVECGQAEVDWGLLQGYASMKVDLRPTGKRSQVRAAAVEHTSDASVGGTEGKNRTMAPIESPGDGGSRNG
jgi:hypothetical protein